MVDEDPRALDTIARCLMSDGHAVLTAADPATGLRALASAHVDVVFADAATAATGDPPMIRRIRRRAPRAPIVLLAGSTGTGSRCCWQCWRSAPG